MEAKFLKDALFGGMTANAFKLGTVLSLGWFWMRVEGCCVLYRGDSIDRIDLADVLAAGEADACEISAPSYVRHEPCSSYFYVLRRISGSGEEEQSLRALVRVRIGSGGELSAPRPNGIYALRARRLVGQKVELIWFYSPLGQESEPVCFRVYQGAGTGEVDYDNPVATLGYAGRRYYSFTSGSLEAGDYVFVVKAEDAAGIQDIWDRSVRVQVEAPGAGDVHFVDARAILS